MIQIFATAKEISLYPNEVNIIDTFQEYGIILGANITYLSSNSHQYNIIKQKLINSQIHKIPLVYQINNPFFKSFYVNGSLQKQIEQNYILSMVPISTGSILAVVLYNNGKLAYIKEDNNNYLLVEQNQSISIDTIQLQNRVYMFYLSTKQQILIILNKQLIKVSINVNESKIFGNNFKQNDDKFLTTQKILLVEDLLFITRNRELSIYSINQEVVENQFQNYNFTYNLDDIKVIFENGIYKVFILNRRFGVTIFSYDPKLKSFNEISSFDQISYKGYLIGVNNQILIIVDEEDNESIIYEFHYNEQFHKWQIYNHRLIQQKIKDIEFTINNVILIGQNGHQIIYHSIPPENFLPQNYVTIPGLQQINLINKTGNFNQTLIGITKHTFYIFQLYQSPQKIICTYTDDLSPIKFIYYQNSTKCSIMPQKQDGNLCLFVSNYTINYIYPIITLKYKIQEEIIVISIVIISIIFILLIVAKRKCKKNVRTRSENQNQSDCSQYGSPKNQDQQALKSHTYTMDNEPNGSIELVPTSKNIDQSPS
ncbi:unnamed protein product [Paramecium sonneborni]|uniref:Transmembrane protein n=1 Tax=Paramecium sonneborni TaxID=65129 RepID=A0A8S1QIA3_9CILI|nr:unnamed protein product [Paramecium sonneborni]